MLDRGLAPSRERAKSTIMSGVVFVNGQRADKPGVSFPEDCEITIRGETLKYVSRGGLKLEKALTSFGIDPAGFCCIDCGASTGGFTDVLLQNGARRVYAVDVGYGQLAWSIRSDERVVCMERTNIRYVTKEQIPEPLDLAVMDLSFISLKLVLPPVRELLKPEGRLVCLIKPQFEAGKERVGKKGVVRDRAVHLAVIEDILSFAPTAGLVPAGLDFSPIKGPEGNIEYLLHLRLEGGAAELDAAAIVEQSHDSWEPERKPECLENI